MHISNTVMRFDLEVQFYVQKSLYVYLILVLLVYVL